MTVAQAVFDVKIKSQSLFLAKAGNSLNYNVVHRQYAGDLVDYVPIEYFGSLLGKTRAFVL